MSRVIVMVCASIPIISLAYGGSGDNQLSIDFPIFQWIVGVALVIIGFFCSRALINIERLFEKSNKINVRLARLETAHRLHHRDNLLQEEEEENV